MIEIGRSENGTEVENKFNRYYWQLFSIFYWFRRFNHLRLLILIVLFYQYLALFIIIHQTSNFNRHVRFHVHRSKVNYPTLLVSHQNLYKVWRIVNVWLQLKKLSCVRNIGIPSLGGLLQFWFLNWRLDGIIEDYCFCYLRVRIAAIHLSH